MSAAIRDEVRKLVEEARQLAHVTLNEPKTEREYMLACGKYKQMMAQARALKERFLDPERGPESELPDDQDDDDDTDPRQPERRRVAPQPDRLARHRARHVPRQA